MIGWINIFKLNSDYFRIDKSNKGGENLDYYLDKIDLDDYWIYKRTNRFRRVEVEEIGKYVGYMFFKKELYKKEDIDKWIEEIKNLKIMFMFLNKPFPRAQVIDKIEVI